MLAFQQPALCLFRYGLRSRLTHWQYHVFFFILTIPSNVHLLFSHELQVVKRSKHSAEAIYWYSRSLNFTVGDILFVRLYPWPNHGSMRVLACCLLRHDLISQSAVTTCHWWLAAASLLYPAHILVEVAFSPLICGNLLGLLASSGNELLINNSGWVKYGHCAAVSSLTRDVDYSIHFKFILSCFDHRWTSHTQIIG